MATPLFDLYVRHMELTIRVDKDGRSWNKKPQFSYEVPATTTWRDFMWSTVLPDVLEGHPEGHDTSHLAAFVMGDKPVFSDTMIVCPAPVLDDYDGTLVEGDQLDGRELTLGTLLIGDAFWGAWDFGSTVWFRCRVINVRQLVG